MAAFFGMLLLGGGGGRGVGKRRDLWQPDAPSHRTDKVETPYFQRDVTPFVLLKEDSIERSCKL